MPVFEKYNIEKIFVLGDIGGYYYYPEKILEKLKQYDCRFIRGNHEIILKKLINNQISSGEVIDKYGHGHDFALKKLTNDQINFLINLPDELTINLEGKSLLLCHANPWNLCDYLYPDTAIDVLTKA